MPQSTGDCAHRYARGHHSSRGEVAQIVQTHVVKTESVSHCLELLGDGPWGHRNEAVWLTGEHVRIGHDLHANLFRPICDDGFLCLEYRERVGVERDTTFCVGLSALLSDPARHFGNRALDGEGHALRIKVAPTKRAHLSSARTGRRGDVQEVAQFGVLSPCVIEQLINLSRIRRREFGLGHPRRGDVGSGVGRYPTQDNGLTERPSNDGVDLAHRCGRQSDLIDESSIELIQVVGGDLIDRAISDGREDPHLQFVPITTKSRRA